MKLLSLPSPGAGAEAVSVHTDLEEVVLMNHTAVRQTLDQAVRQRGLTAVSDPETQQHIMCYEHVIIYECVNHSGPKHHTFTGHYSMYSLFYVRSFLMVIKTIFLYALYFILT